LSLRSCLGLFTRRVLELDAGPLFLASGLMADLMTPEMIVHLLGRLFPDVALEVSEHEPAPRGWVVGRIGNVAERQAECSVRRRINLDQTRLNLDPRSVQEGRNLDDGGRPVEENGQVKTSAG
jgi:hypothetical protein